jgi:acetyl esterase/lipase
LAITKFNSLAEKAELQPNNYILLGESAGGHLALLYGYQNPDKIKKIISLSGPRFLFSGISQFFYSKYSSPTIQKMVGTKFIAKIFQKNLKKQVRLPIFQTFLLSFQGNQDFLVNQKQGLALDSALTAQNIPHKFVFMENTGHAPRFSAKERDSIIYPNI